MCRGSNKGCLGYFMCAKGGITVIRVIASVPGSVGKNKVPPLCLRTNVICTCIKTQVITVTKSDGSRYAAQHSVSLR